jgi:hypothetical protein
VSDRNLDTDIEFDFFDDAPPREAPSEEPPPPRRGPRMPPRPPDVPRPRLLRLALLIGGAILLAVVLVLWVNSCREDRRRSEYGSYMEKAGAVGLESEQIGKDLTKLITTPGVTLSDLQAGIEGLRAEQAQNVARAQRVDSPGTLREEQESLVEALQFRVSGLAGLAAAFGAIKETDDPEEAGAVLAEQSKRLLASDVLWADLFKARSQAVLRQEGVSGIAVPDSAFVADDELFSPQSWTLLVQRVVGGVEAGGLRGTALESVRALPSGPVLSPEEENTVTASERLGFQVSVKNSGDIQLTQVKVNLTLQLSPDPVTKTGTIELINPGDTKRVAFRDFDVAGSFGTLVTLKVSVEPVEGEENTANNAAEYSVIFTFG